MKPTSSSTPMSQGQHTSNSDTVCPHLDTFSVEATRPPTTGNFDHLYADMPRVNTPTLMDEDAHQKEMLVAQLDLIRQQARIKWLEDSKPQQEDCNNNIMIPSLHPVHSQQNIWEIWYKSKHGQLHQTTPSENEEIPGGANRTKTTIIVMTMKTMQTMPRLLPLKYQMMMTLQQFWIYP
jgi:hypothetical protein